MVSIRVFLIEDHTILREGLRALLEAEPDLVVVGESGDAVEGVRAIQEKLPDVVLMDVELPETSGAAATEAIRRVAPQTHVLALTMHRDAKSVISMLRAGALGYLLKTSTRTELAAAIRKVNLGQAVLDPAIARIVIDELAPSVDSSATPNVLTARELEVLELVAAAKSSRQIAELLGLSPKTVDNVRAHIIRKLRARNKLEAVTIALQQGLIHVNET
jgi:DNA-binding NarL/FixJ family response regulator